MPVFGRFSATGDRRMQLKPSRVVGQEAEMTTHAAGRPISLMSVFGCRWRQMGRAKN